MIMSMIMHFFAVGAIIGGVVALIFILAVTVTVVVLAVIMRGRQNKTPQEK